jgi:hypothetical protein
VGREASGDGGARPASAGGAKVERAGQIGKNHFSIYFLKNNNIFTFLSNKNSLSQVGPKIKVV